MLWRAHLPENVAQPVAVEALLRRSLHANPDNPRLHAKLGFLSLDRKSYGAAAASFEAALRLDPTANVRPQLARCYNYLHRPEAALALLAKEETASFERGRAMMELRDIDTAEREFRAILATDPNDRAACRMLCRLLRKSGRQTELTSTCEDLAARGARNAQFLFNWGWALALAGDQKRARRLMYEPERIERVDLPVPAGFTDMAAFNAALAEEILGNPNRVSEFPIEDEANRGSSRVDNLFTGRRPELIAQLLSAFQEAVEQYVPDPQTGFDPWSESRPGVARLRPWGLMQRLGEYEEGHIHPGGWLSGVYYVCVPSGVSAEGDGPGCIEFGPPTAIAKAQPDLAPTGRYLPNAGTLLLSPSHYQHRTIPSHLDAYRISVAFDVLPEQ